MESFYYVPLITLLTCLISQGDCIKCYICSFSPDDRNNRTDKCTESNFQHQNVYSDECKLGCESVIQYDPNAYCKCKCLRDIQYRGTNFNERNFNKCTESNFQHQNMYSDEYEMEQWRRNCLQEGHKMTNDCQTEKTIGYKLVRCTCDRDLCNISDRTTSGYITLLMSVLTFLWNYHSKLK